MRSAPFSMTHNQGSLDWKTSLFLKVCRKAVSHIFADICTPRARLRKHLSKDGFPTLEYRLKPLAGHLYGPAKIVTGGRTPKSKPTLPHAMTAVGKSAVPAAQMARARTLRVKEGGTNRRVSRPARATAPPRAAHRAQGSNALLARKMILLPNV